MSDSLAPLAGGLIGAAAFSFIPGVGTSLGFAVGSALVGSFTAPDQTVTGPRLDDLSVSPSEFGAPIAIPYGTVMVPGTVIWLNNNEIKETREEETSGGKGGGPKQTRVTFTYSATFAVTLCEGPIAGVRRIWADAVLLYDGRDNADPEALLSGVSLADGESGNVEQGTTDDEHIGSVVLYKGTETQRPDPTIEADRGMGNVPAYRGTVYLLFGDLQLEKWGDRLPNIRAEVVTQSSGSRPELMKTTVVEALQQGNRSLGQTDWIRLEDDLVIANARPGVPDPESASDKSEQVDHRFTLSGDFIGRKFNGYAKSDDIVQHYRLGVFGDDNSSEIALGFISSTSEWQLASHPVGAASKSSFFVLARDDDAGPVGAAAVEPRRRHFWHFDPVFDFAGVLLHHNYTRYDVGGRAVQTGRVLNAPRRFGYSRFTDINADWPAMESSGRRLWTVRPDKIFMYELNIDGDFDLIGSVNVSGDISAIAIADDGVCFQMTAEGVGGGDQHTRISIVRANASLPETSQTLASIIDDLADRVGVSVDTLGVTQNVRGYRIDRPMPVRSAIEPLRTAFPFDLPQVGYSFSAVSRGGSSVATITDDDLAAHEPGEELPARVATTRKLETEMDRRVRVQYFDVDASFEQGSQYAGRLVTESERERDVQLPIVLSADEAAQIADNLLREEWNSALTAEGSVSIQLAQLTPADVITLDTEVLAGQLRIQQIDDGRPGIRRLALVAESVYDSSAKGVGGEDNSETLGLPGPTELVLMDLPTLRDRDDGPGFYFALAGVLDGWQGGELFRSPDGQAFASVTASTESATVGRATEALADGPVGIWDRASTLNLDLVAGDLVSVSESDVLDGSNALAIRAGTSWEIVQFVDATLEDDGSVTISTLLRGRKGTEWTTAMHAAGDDVVGLNVGVFRQSIDADSIGTQRAYKGVSFGRPVSRSPSQQFTAQGQSLKPYAPVHLQGSRNASGNLTVTWVRRARIAGAWRDFIETPVIEASESYEVDVMDGSTVVRTLTSTTPSVTYTASDQQTDFGSVQLSITLRVYQINATVGRGTKAEITL